MLLYFIKYHTKTHKNHLNKNKKFINYYKNKIY